MRTLILALALFLASISPAHASGFGWYLYLFDWEAADSELRGMVESYKELSVSNPGLAYHFQEDIDRAIWSICNSNDFNDRFSVHVKDANPIYYEFYSIETIEFLQKNHSESLFLKFSNDSDRYLVRKPRTTPTDRYVVFSPSEIEGLLDIVSQYRNKKEISNYLKFQLTQMEASFLFATSDRPDHSASASSGMGAIFCGHD